MEVKEYNNRQFIYLQGRRRIPSEILALDTENLNSVSNIENKTTALWAIQMGSIKDTFEDENWLYKDWKEVFENLKIRLLPFYDDNRTNKNKIYPNIIIYVHNLAHDWSHMK